MISFKWNHCTCNNNLKSLSDCASVLCCVQLSRAIYAELCCAMPVHTCRTHGHTPAPDTMFSVSCLLRRLRKSPGSCCIDAQLSGSCHGSNNKIEWLDNAEQVLSFLGAVMELTTENCDQRLMMSQWHVGMK